MCRIMEEVHAEGRAEGRAENTREIMDNMIAAGLLSDAEIALYTGTTPEQVAARRRSVSA